MGAFDVFVSYAHADRERVLELRDALGAQGLVVWLDDREIDSFGSISAGIEQGLAHSKALLAFYSETYPVRRACQWELTAAFVAAQRSGRDPRERVLVINPEQGAGHIAPIELRDARYAAAAHPGDRDSHAALAARVAEHVAGLEGVLGELGVGSRPLWMGRSPVGATRFVGRVPDMWAVHSAMTAGRVGLIAGAHGGDPAVKVTGMGGIGKSLLAVEYALRFAAAYPGGVFWLRAHGHDDRGDTMTTETRDAERNTQLHAFATEHGIAIGGVGPGQLALAIGTELDRRGQTFLWIVDDLPANLPASELESWYAPGRFGRTLMTTRSLEYRSTGAQIVLGVLPPQEGYELLLKHRLPEGREEEAAARGLVGDLGGHALALDVAGGALDAERGVRSYQEYRAALANPNRDELEVAAGLAGELPDGHDASIASTLARSIAQLSEAGLDVLRLASALAADPIPAALIVSVFAGVDDLADDAGRDRAVSGMQETATRSLAEPTDDGSARRVHTLISRAIALLEPSAARSEALADTALTVLTTQLDRAAAGRVAADDLTLAHARHLAAALMDERHARLLSEIAMHDSFRGDYRLARTQQQHVLDAYQRLLADDHPATLRSMSNLALTVGALGDHAGAQALLDHVLATYRRVLGDEHPDTLASMSNLAATRRALGDYEGARALQEHALAAYRGVLGDEHPHTLLLMNNLAETLRALGDRAGAQALHEQALVAYQGTLGDEHPRTLMSMTNLAETLRTLGDHAGARALHEQALSAYRRVLGDDHPHTVLSMSNLALTLRALGDHAGARALHEQALAAHRRLLGDEHPHTLMSMNNLASTLRVLGDHAGAQALHEEALAAYRRVLGDEHPDTLQSMNNLALALWELGDHADARTLLEQALTGYRRVLGDEHPTTLTSIENLAAALWALGEHASARALLEQARASR